MHIEDICGVFENLYTRLRSVEIVDFSIVQNVQKVLVIRSADMTTFRNFMKRLRDVTPDVYIYVITHEIDRKDVIDICGKNSEVITYRDGGNYDAAKLTEVIKYIQGQAVEEFFLLYNNRFGIGYENVLNLLSCITQTTVYAFNCYWDLLRIEKPLLHLETLKLINAIADWHWEYLVAHEEG